MTPASGQGIASIAWLVLVVAVFYLLAIRPQQKRNKEHQRLLSSLKTGDDIITAGGIYGRVTKIEEQTVTVEIAKGTSVVFDKRSITGEQDSSKPVKES